MRLSPDPRWLPTHLEMLPELLGSGPIPAGNSMRVTGHLQDGTLGSKKPLGQGTACLICHHSLSCAGSVAKVHSFPPVCRFSFNEA